MEATPQLILAARRSDLSPIAQRKVTKMPMQAMMDPCKILTRTRRIQTDPPMLLLTLGRATPPQLNNF